MPVRKNDGMNDYYGKGGNVNFNCFECGKKGHMFRKCPKRYRGTTTGVVRRLCYKCGEDGHMYRDCPENVRSCFRCGRKGHLYRACSENGRSCFRCGRKGHMYSDCPEKRGCSEGRFCFICGGKGHMYLNCPEKIRCGGASDRRTYYNYEDEGDLTLDCLNAAITGGAKYIKSLSKITEKNKEPHVDTFEQLISNKLVLENLEKCKYEHPTLIQQHCSPQLLAGKDVMCCTPKCSGKTAAYLLPIISNLLLKKQSELLLSSSCDLPAKPEALILAPTRELVIQIGKEANMYADRTPIKTVVVYGGVEFKSTVFQLKSGVNILVGTTGRLQQLIRQYCVDLSHVKYFILDEADRMLDMNFIQDVEEIIKKLSPKKERVTGFFSATYAMDIQISATRFLNDYVYIVIGVVGGASSDDIKQEVITVDRKEKRHKLVEILQDLDKDVKVIVFCASKISTDYLASYLSFNQISCTSIHGDRLQSERENALQEFITGRRQVMVATGIASRGLDLPNIGLVINYDFPFDKDEYVHMIGRIGRFGNSSGRVISFYDSSSDNKIK